MRTHEKTGLTKQMGANRVGGARKFHFPYPVSFPAIPSNKCQFQSFFRSTK